MKQFSLITLPLLCAAISPLSADAMGNRTTKANSNGNGNQQPMNQITPSANPEVTHCCDPFITAEFIWWKAQEDGLIYAYDGTATANTFVSASKGHAHQPDFSYEPGFKVGFGLKYRHDGWDTYANYTWFRTSFDDTKETNSTPASSSMASNYFIFGPGFSVIAGSARGEWSLHFNALDAELGRNFWISQWLTLRPHFGLKFSWMDQDFNVRYNNASAGSVDAGANVRIRNDQDQWAVGIRTGLDTAWYMWRKWSIFGEFAISALYNDFDITRKDRVQSPVPGEGTITSLHVDRHFRAVTAVLELALGLRFETAFHCDDYLFWLQAGWEEQIWFNQNRFFIIADQGSKDLTFQGLTVKTGFAF